jgi:hypothetical protein
MSPLSLFNCNFPEEISTGKNSEPYYTEQGDPHGLK